MMIVFVRPHHHHLLLPQAHHRHLSQNDVMLHVIPMWPIQVVLMVIRVNPIVDDAENLLVLIGKIVRVRWICVIKNVTPTWQIQDVRMDWCASQTVVGAENQLVREQKIVPVLQRLQHQHQLQQLQRQQQLPLPPLFLRLFLKQEIHFRA